MIIYPSLIKKSESRTVLIVALGLFGMGFMAGAISISMPRERLVKTDNISIYSSNTKMYRFESRTNYVPIAEDVVMGDLYESKKERNIFLGVVIGLCGLINTIVLGRAIYGRCRFKDG